MFQKFVKPLPDLGAWELQGRTRSELTRTSPRGLVGAEGMREQPSTFPDTISELQEPQNSDSRDRDFWHFACRPQQSRPCATHFPGEHIDKN